MDAVRISVQSSTGSFVCHHNALPSNPVLYSAANAWFCIACVASVSLLPDYNFTGTDDGALPTSGPLFDSIGNLYGASSAGNTSTCDDPDPCGLVYKLSPVAGGWQLAATYPVGGNPAPGTLAIDSAGNLYGATNADREPLSGEAYQIVP